MFDMASAFWQVELDPKVRKYFSFHVPNVGTVCSTRLVQGATNSAQTLKRVLDKIYGDLFLKIGGHWFIDDASWGSGSTEKAMAEIKEFLRISLKHNVKLDSGKAQFMVSKANILGERVSKEGIEIQRKHITHLEELKSPKSMKDLMSVTGVLSYHQHRSPRIALGLNMLYDALKQNKKGDFQWSKDQEKGLRELVDIVITADKKSFLLPDKGQDANDYPLIFSSDAGAGGVGVCISQVQPENIDRWMKMGPEKGEKRVLRLLDVYAKRFKEHERAWSVFRREITALAACSLKFEFYFNQPNIMKFCRVDSRSIAFCINAANKSTVFHEFLYRLECDYRPIAIIWTEREYNALADWLSKLGGNDFEPERSLGWLEVMEKQGKLKVLHESEQMKEEDSINRKLLNPDRVRAAARINSINLRMMKNGRKKRKIVEKNNFQVKQIKFDDEDSVVENPYPDEDFYPDQYRYDEKHVKNKTKNQPRSDLESLKAFHDEFHLTVGGTMKILQKCNLNVDETEVERIIKECQHCKTIRVDRYREKMESPSVLEVTPGPFHTIAIDVISGLMKDSNKCNVLVAKCVFSNYMLAKPMDDATGTSIIKALKEWCRDIFVVMPIITGDNAKNMRSEEFYQFCKEYNTSITPKNPYNPQNNEVERGIREVQERLTRHKDSSWTEALYRIIPSINLSPSPALNNKSPSEIVFGRTMNYQKFISLSRGENFTPNSINMDYEGFRQIRQDKKYVKQAKRLLTINSRVFVRDGIRSWGTKIYIVVRKNKKSVGVYALLDPTRKELSRGYNDVKMA